MAVKLSVIAVHLFLASVENQKPTPKKKLIIAQKLLKHICQRNRDIAVPGQVEVPEEDLIGLSKNEVRVLLLNPSKTDEIIAKIKKHNSFFYKLKTKKASVVRWLRKLNSK